MNPPLSSKELELLRAINTPTIANALEVLGASPRDEGFTSEPVRCMFPDLGVTVGYAITLTVRSTKPPESSRPSMLKAYWDHIGACPTPRVVVAQDLDEHPVGAWWGEINANIHRALGCIGVVTNGTVRDLDEVKPLGFQFVAAGLAVSHVHAHLEDFGKTVSIGGMKVKPGDIIHADKHGAIVIPQAQAKDVLKAVLAVESYERPLIQLCKSPAFSTLELERLMTRKVI